MKMPIDGGILTKARQMMGMSKHQLAEAMRVTPTCVNTWERGEVGVTGITSGNWAKLCHLLRIHQITNGPAVHPCEGCRTPVAEYESYGDTRLDGTDEYLCEGCYQPVDDSPSGMMLRRTTPVVLNLVLSPELAEALKQAADDQYRTVELQALWAIRMTLAAEGHLEGQGGAK